MGDGGAEGDGGREGVRVGIDDFVAALFAFAWGGGKRLVGGWESVKRREEETGK